MSRRHVYFAKPVGMDGPIKIGCSTLPHSRLMQLATWSPFPLEIIGFVPGTFADETFIHQCFADLHTRHEWFMSSPALRETIQAILDGGSIDSARSILKSKGKIRNTLGKKRSDESRRRQSYNFRIIWACKRLHIETEHERVYFSAPKDVCEIIERWGGNPYRGIDAIPPTDAEIALIDEFLANPALLGIPNQVKRIPKAERAA